MKKLLFSLGALCFLAACGDSDMIKFSKEDLADPRLQEGLNKIKAKNNNANLEFYKLESIQKSKPENYNHWKRKEVKSNEKFFISVYAINKDKNNIPLLYNISCSIPSATDFGCAIYDKTESLEME